MPEKIDKQMVDEYFDKVYELKKWYLNFIEENFSHVQRGSGDTLMDLHNLKERLENEGLEMVGYGEKESTNE